MRRAPLLLLLAPILLGAAPSDAALRLARAKGEAAAASARADALAAAAMREQDAAARARAEERALGVRVEAAAATVRAAEARMVLVTQSQDEQRARLAAAQAPVAHLLAALTDLARRPTIAAVAQPGSLDDLVHVRAVLGTALPAVQARTRPVRTELEATRRLVASAALAADALGRSRAALVARRAELARLEATHSGQAQALTRDAIGQSDRALALGERARDLVDQMTEAGQADATAAELAALPAPVPRPLAPGARPPESMPTYRLPVHGALVTGLGEVSDAGVRARGLTFSVAPNTPVLAPAGGVIRYAGRFRSFGTIVLIDHGAGWTSLLTALATATARRGDRIVAGAPVGRAAASERPQIGVELRRRGRPVDIAALL